jgi:hypothetical protein
MFTDIASCPARKFCCCRSYSRINHNVYEMGQIQHAQKYTMFNRRGTFHLLALRSLVPLSFGVFLRALLGFTEHNRLLDCLLKGISMLLV